MKRWKKVLIWTLSVVVVLGVGGLFAANYAVDRLMNSMASSFDIEVNTSPDDTVSGEVTEPTVAAGEVDVDPNQSIEPNEVSSSSKDNPGNTTVTEAKANSNEQKDSSSSDEPKPVPATNSVDGIAHISTEKAKEVQENITIKEKTSIASILLRELSASDIKKLQQLASGGLSNAEKKEARGIIIGKLSEDQYNELIQIAKKYGLSEGKTYSKGSDE